MLSHFLITTKTSYKWMNQFANSLLDFWGSEGETKVDDCSDVCGIVAPGLTVSLSVRVGWEVIIGPDWLKAGTVSDWLVTVLLGRSLVSVELWLTVIVAGDEFSATLPLLHCILVVASTTSTSVYWKPFTMEKTKLIRYDLVFQL